MRIVASAVPFLTGLRAALPGRDGRLQRVEQVVRAVRLSRLLRLPAKPLAPKSTNLPSRLTEFFGQLLVASYGIGVSAFPITDFAAKFADRATQLPQFLLHALQGRAVSAGKKRLRRLTGAFQKRGTHGPTLYPN